MTFVFTFTIFLSAFLLFFIQPMMAKSMLPYLGGAPAVWNAAMVFFQVTLLLGYVYAHFLGKFFKARLQVIIHCLVFLLSLIFLPIELKINPDANATANPVTWVFLLLVVSIGLPFFILSASAPLLQSWFSKTNHTNRDNPYFLYAASNAGSLLALMSYPFLIEPWLKLILQRTYWSYGYGLLALCFIISALLLYKRHQASDRATLDIGTPPDIKDYLYWIILAFVPSSMMLGLTQYITTDISPVPLFWVVPLAIYLLSFVIVFARNFSLRKFYIIQVLILSILAAVMSYGAFPINFGIDQILIIATLNLLGFFLVAITCHGRLAEVKPQASYLTQFYVCLSIGGALGGIFNTLIAPNIFDHIIEYPLAVALACVLWPMKSRQELRSPHTSIWDHPVMLSMLFVASFMVMQIFLRIGASNYDEIINFFAGQSGYAGLDRWFKKSSPIRLSQAAFLFYLILSVGMCIYVMRNKYALGFSIFAIMLTGIYYDIGFKNVMLTERNFFGVYRVSEQDRIRKFMHGTTLHATQAIDDPLSTSTYYNKEGPLGQVFATLGTRFENRNIAALGLGAGTLACLGTRTMNYTFFEIDPFVVDMANNPAYFTYMRDCLPKKEVIIGDGRLMLKRDKKLYNLMIMDAFTSDAVPVHLLTREAMEVYLERLEPDGVIAFHITNRHLDLKPVLANVANELGLIAIYQRDIGRAGRLTTEWVIIARDWQDLGQLMQDTRWGILSPDKSKSTWTDDYSNIFSVLK